MSNTIIVGGGKIGYYLAKTLRDSGSKITIIEQNEKRSQYLANELGIPVVCGDASEIRVLAAANIKSGDTVVCITGKDQDNLVVCQLVKMLYNVHKTVARVNNPKNIAAMKELGADIAISSTDSIIKQLEREVDNSCIKELLSLNDGKTSVMEVTLPEKYPLDHKMIQDVQIPDSCNIISITRGNEFIIPRGKTKLLSRDILLIVVAAGAQAEVRKALKLKK